MLFTCCCRVLAPQAHQAKGKTALYIPAEDVSDAREAAKDKDLVQRLESTVIHWTRQIKEVPCRSSLWSPSTDAVPCSRCWHLGFHPRL